MNSNELTSAETDFVEFRVHDQLQQFVKTRKARRLYGFTNRPRARLGALPVSPAARYACPRRRETLSDYNEVFKAVKKQDQTTSEVMAIGIASIVVLIHHFTAFLSGRQRRKSLD
ncbi:uncharacterized protein LOC143253721 isoform X1 [Tachypleus tridentatus]|uniref:uncharacterized protein LOC143253721 isoform X1 n=1 Tax=Tachypleus tridentatus TaxID=6853 RepID=UPI003FD5FB80